MKNRQWNREFPDVPEYVHHTVSDTLAGLGNGQEKAGMHIKVVQKGEKMKRIVLTGGGKAGHVYPALAVAENLKDYEIHYIGGSGIEKEILANFKNITYHTIPTVKFERKLTLKNLFIPIKLAKAVKSAKKVLAEVDPDVIFSKGGFVAVPVVLAGRRENFKIVSHESDLSFGLANKIILKFCNMLIY